MIVDIHRQTESLGKESVATQMELIQTMAYHLKLITRGSASTSLRHLVWLCVGIESLFVKGASSLS